MNKELPFRKTVVSHVVNLQYSLMLPIKQTSSALLRLSKSCWKSTRDNNCCHHTMFIFNQVMKNVWHSKHRLSPQDTVRIPGYLPAQDHLYTHVRLCFVSGVKQLTNRENGHCGPVLCSIWQHAQQQKELAHSSFVAISNCMLCSWLGDFVILPTHPRTTAKFFKKQE